MCLYYGYILEFSELEGPESMSRHQKSLEGGSILGGFIFSGVRGRENVFIFWLYFGISELGGGAESMSRHRESF